MKKLHIVGLIGILAISQSLAGDLPSKKKTPEQPVKIVTPYNWSGAYVGVTASALMGQTSQKVSGINQIGLNGVNVNQSVILPSKLNKSSALYGGGLTLGYNYQSGNYVYGVEADVMALNSGKNARNTAAYTSAGNPYTSTSSGKINQNFVSTLRYRGGYAFDNVLVYGTAGLAMANVKAKSIFQIRDVTAGPPDDIWTGSKSTMKYGYALGGGVEYAYTKNITLKAEYLYYNVGKVKYTTAGDNYTSTVDQIGTAQKIKANLNGNVIRIGLNYKF